MYLRSRYYLDMTIPTATPSLLYIRARFAIVIIEHATQPLSPLNWAGDFYRRVHGSDQAVFQSLVVPLQMIVRKKLRDRDPQ